ncbi:glutamate synthase [Photobacterium aquae]|uniref:Glutamate synthase n=1 Tax=Photobacterium aquae TaxID=1195763 RepID=A0A0J1H3S2_9GAMM|nr:TIGR03503 family protein [Photobacterium aquae]KLV06436.1 glutamate synthase [Photobacterium aquae]
MKRFCWLLLLVPVLSWATEKSEMTWLDNRFRVDDTVEQVSFVIKRENNSQPVVLVRPDGHKYYYWRHPDSVAWYQSPDMDIISIDHPMPGPWQAVGKVSPYNEVKILSNLKLTVDRLPARLYQSETLKFSARLTQNGKPLTDRDFLDKMKLSVEFYEYVELADGVSSEALPKPIVMGEFADDGTGFDERPGDGTFTVELAVDLQPGKYQVVINSGNAIFERAVEQTVLIYPPPLTAIFIQGKTADEMNQVIIDTEDGSIKPGSLAAHIEQKSFDDDTTICQEVAIGDEESLKVLLPNGQKPGSYSWSGWLYATDSYDNRELVFRLPESHFAVMADLELDSDLAKYRAQQQVKKRNKEIARITAEREEARDTATKIIIMTNVLVIILGIAGFIFWRKRKVKRLLEEAGGLDIAGVKD